MMADVTLMDRDYFKSKGNPNSEKDSYLTKCCGENTERHILNKNNDDDWKLIEEYCEKNLNAYSRFKSITPLFCDDCGRLLEYKVKLYNKKTWK